MTATTIKLEDPLLRDLKSIIPKRSNLSAFVKTILEKAINQQKLEQAAHAYTAFLEKNPEEAHWLSDWENAPLAQAPEPIAKTKPTRKST